MHYGVQMSVNMEIVTDIVFHKTELRIPYQMSDVFRASGNQIIQRDYIMPLPNQQIQTSDYRETLPHP